MKKFLINYYAVIILVLFISYNTILINLKIDGIVSYIMMGVLITVNIIVLIKWRKYIKWKSLVIMVYFFICFFSKNLSQFFFAISSMLILIIIGFSESRIIKILTILIALFTSIFHFIIIFIFLFTFCTDDIYEDTHYYCKNNHEIYSYSLGAIDGFHYSIGRYYEFININDILNISYHERNEKTEVEYENFLNNNNCSLVGDRYGSK